MVAIQLTKMMADEFFPANKQWENGRGERGFIALIILIRQEKIRQDGNIRNSMSVFSISKFNTSTCPQRQVNGLFCVFGVITKIGCSEQSLEVSQDSI
jgi:hypothetical protein